MQPRQPRPGASKADKRPLTPQGTSTKYSPQRVGLTHTMEHEDVIQIVKK